VLAYRVPRPTPADVEALAELPELVRPLVELEHEVPGSCYVNALAVRPVFRRRGIATRLLGTVASRARESGCSTLSVGVFSENETALRLYEREGFRVIGERPVAAHPCYARTDRVLMLLKEI
jgi:ribosomal protein S18 acetylase RimI-like enzyme